MTANDDQINACRRCGKRAGTMRDVGRGKFRFYVICGACSFMTAVARTEGIALKLWNEATPGRQERKKPARCLN